MNSVVDLYSRGWMLADEQGIPEAERPAWIAEWMQERAEFEADQLREGGKNAD